MATMVIGMKTGIFCLKETTWECTTSLESDVLIEVTGFSFYLHKFPLISCSPILKRLIVKHSCDGTSLCAFALHEIPGGASTFELIAKFSYGEKIEVSPSNAIPLLCAAYYLDMTENNLERNLISQVENFMSNRILSNWKETIMALDSCESVLHYAEELDIISACLDSIAHKAAHGKSSFQHPLQKVSWNGIAYMDEAPKKLGGADSSFDWWFCDISSLSLHLFKRFIGLLGAKGHDPVIISNAVIYYTGKHHPGFKPNSTGTWPIDPRMFLEEIINLLPVQKGVTSTKFLLSVLNTSIMLNADAKCIQSLEKKIGAQLEESTVEDLLVPNLDSAKEKVYDINCIQRIIEQFVRENFHVGELPSNSSSDDYLTEAGSHQFAKIAALAKFFDEYLLKISADTNLKFHQFHSLASAIPVGRRHSDDELYRAINSYIEHHPELSDQQKEGLCQLIDIQNLSADVCREVVQNERLPLRVMVKALFFEMHHLKSSIVELETDNRIQTVTGTDTVNEIDSVEGRDLVARCVQLQKDCENMKKEIKISKKAEKTKMTWGSFFVKNFFSARVVKALLAAPSRP